MAKLLLISVVIMMIAMPVMTSRDRNAHRGVRRTVLFFFIFNVLYLLAVRFLYPRLY
jgi:hypothetical protein